MKSKEEIAESLRDAEADAAMRLAGHSNQAIAEAAYTAEGFGRADHIDLAIAALEAASRGATVLISNHDSTFTRELYQGFDVVQLSAERTVAASASKRREVRELLATIRLV